MENLTIFINRLKKIGITLELTANYPWVYLDSINGKKVKERKDSDWGYVLGYRNKNFTFAENKELFKLIRKYL